MENQSMPIFFRTKFIRTFDLVGIITLFLVFILLRLPIAAIVIVPVLLFYVCRLGNKHEDIEILDNKITVGVMASRWSTVRTIDIENINEVKIGRFRVILLGRDPKRSRNERVLFFKSFFSKETLDEIIEALVATNPNIKI